MLRRKKELDNVDSTQETKTNDDDYSPKAIQKAKDAVIKALDQNGNGQLEIEDLIILALKTPGIYKPCGLFKERVD